MNRLSDARAAEPAARAGWGAVAVVVLLSLAGAALLRATGIQWPLEARMLDARLRLAQQEDASRVIMVLESEADLKAHGYPLPDGVLAVALANILASGAQGVAVDKFRDRPVAPGSEKLEALLREFVAITWVARFDGGTGRGVPPPAAAREPGRHGCADLVTDRDGVVRRALLAQEAGPENCLSLPLVTVMQALASGGQLAGFTDSPPGLQLGDASFVPLAPSRSLYAASELGGFQIELPHRVRTVPSVPLARVLEGPVPELRGKVVFLGSSATSLGDRHRFPLALAADRGYVAGVEVHARQAEDLLRLAAGQLAPVTPPPWRMDFLFAVVVTILAAWSILRARARWMPGLVLPIVLTGGTIALAWAEAWGWRAELLPALLAAALATAGGWARKVAQERQERAELRALFSRQVAPEVAEALWRNRDAFYQAGRIPPVEVEVTVLFADLRGFTSLTEQLDREAMVAWLNGAIGVMTRAVMEQGGVVTRFGGDQVMAVWGVPVPRTDPAELKADARRALHASLLLRDRLAALNARQEQAGLPAARVRVGVQSGRALQAGVGSEDRFEFTVLGDVVNTAARLESLAAVDDGSAARIFAGDHTIALCGDHFLHEKEGVFELKGKANTVTVYRIKGEKT